MKMKTLFSAMSLLILCGTLAAVPLPDPPPGDYDLGVTLNDGSDTHVPTGQPLIYPSFENGVWGVRVYGWVLLPAPNPGSASQWKVVCTGLRETVSDTWPTGFTTVTVSSVWTGVTNVGHWTMFIPSEWNFARTPSLPPGVYEVYFVLYIDSPGTGGWMFRKGMTGYTGW